VAVDLPGVEGPAARMVAGAVGPEDVDRMAGADHADADAIGLRELEHRGEHAVVDLPRPDVRRGRRGECDPLTGQHLPSNRRQPRHRRSGLRRMRRGHPPVPARSAQPYVVRRTAGHDSCAGNRVDTARHQHAGRVAQDPAVLRVDHVNCGPRPPEQLHHRRHGSPLDLRMDLPRARHPPSHGRQRNRRTRSNGRLRWRGRRRCS
jgi:hypothetical protein